MLAWKHVSWESDEDFARLVTQAQLMHDANQLFISHADQPADTPAAGCDTVDEHTIFDLDKVEELEEEQVLCLAHRLWQRAQELNLCLLAPLCSEQGNSELPWWFFTDTSAKVLFDTLTALALVFTGLSPCSCVHWPVPLDSTRTTLDPLLTSLVLQVTSQRV